MAVINQQSVGAGSIEDRATGALLGLAIGDAIGTTLEFRARDTYQPLTDMVGGGPFGLQVGEWTDDTAMALALADSLQGRDGAACNARWCHRQDYRWPMARKNKNRNSFNGICRPFT